jgi:hypothetical protein
MPTRTGQRLRASQRAKPVWKTEIKPVWKTDIMAKELKACADSQEQNRWVPGPCFDARS